jgi:hypothetical protein
MVESELWAAFRAGRIGRRAFIQGMAALGLSISAANHLADRAQAQVQPPTDDVYDDVYHHNGGQGGHGGMVVTAAMAAIGKTPAPRRRKRTPPATAG